MTPSKILELLRINSTKSDLAYQTLSDKYTHSMLLDYVSELQLGVDMSSLIILGELDIFKLALLIKCFIDGVSVICIDKFIPGIDLTLLPHQYMAYDDESYVRHYFKVTNTDSSYVAPLAIPGCELKIAFRENIDQASEPPPTIGFLTSGTSGAPKVILQSHNSFLSFVTECLDQCNLSTSSRMLCTSSLMWDLIGFEIFACIFAGGCILRLDNTTSANSLIFFDIIETYNINTIECCQTFLDLAIRQSRPASPLSCLKQIYLTGEPIFRRRRYADYFPEANFYAIYGSCEAHNVFSNDISTEISLYDISYGKPWLSVKKIRKPKNPALPFELVINSSTLCIGIIANNLMVAPPEEFHTRDYFTCAEGRWIFCGRAHCNGNVQESLKLFAIKKKIQDLHDELEDVGFLEVIRSGDIYLILLSPFPNSDLLEQTVLLRIKLSFPGCDFLVNNIFNVPRNIHGKVDVRRINSIDKLSKDKLSG